MNPAILYLGGTAVVLYLLTRLQKGGGLGGLVGLDLGIGAPVIESEALGPDAVEAVVAVIESAAPLSAVVVNPPPGGNADRAWFSTRYAVEIELRNSNLEARNPLVELDATFEFLAGGTHRQRSNLGRHSVPGRGAAGPGLTRIKADVEVGDSRALVLPAEAAPVRVLVDGAQVSATWYTVTP